MIKKTFFRDIVLVVLEKKKFLFHFFLSIFIVLWLLEGFFVISPNERGVIMRFEKVVSVDSSPGLKIKLPFLQKVEFFDKRLQDIILNMSGNSEVIALDQKTMQLDAYSITESSIRVNLQDKAKGDKELRKIASNWGSSSKGKNQLLEHTIGLVKSTDNKVKREAIKRLTKISELGGVDKNILKDALSGDDKKVTAALKLFDKLSDDVIRKADIKSLDLNGGEKKAYFTYAKDEILRKKGKGNIVIKHKEKKQTLMPGDTNYFYKHLTNKRQPSKIEDL